LTRLIPRMLQPHDPAAQQSAAGEDLHGHLRVDEPDSGGNASGNRDPRNGQG
jgi:hypothetical protein